MSYKLNKTDGTLLTDLIDGQIDTATTNITLVGKNYSGFGEFINENFIKLLENFANTAAPSNPLDGQLWWNTSLQRLQVWDGEQWKASGGPFVQDSRPQMVAGDLWIDNQNKQIYFYDGNQSNELTLIGPIYNSFQGLSGFEIESLLDQQDRSRPVTKLYVAGELVGLFSNLEFTPTIQKANELGLITDDNPSGVVKKGFNPIDTANFKFHGTAIASEALVNEAGDVVTANQFLPSDSAGTTSGTLTILNNGGITIGLSQNNVQKVVGNAFLIENQLTDQDLSLRVKSSAYGTLTTDALYIDATQGFIGMFKSDPEYTVDVGGDVRIEGNLLVQGETTQLSVQTLEVENKLLVLAYGADSTIGDDAVANGGGLLLKSLEDDKEFLWKSSTNSWSSSVNFDLTNDTLSYKIGGVVKLTDDSIGPSVKYADGLERIGTLVNLNVDNTNINGTTITTTDTGLNINSAGTINVNNQKITGVTTPVSFADAVAAGDPGLEDSADTVATKGYVDTQIDSERVIITLDTTGLTDQQIGFILNSVYPASEKEEGTQGFVITQTLSGSTASNIDVDAVKNISYIPVDANGTLNESVVQDIAFFPASGNVTVSITRGLKRYEVQTGNWVFQSDVYGNYTSAPGWP